MSESEMTLAATIARQAVEDRDHARDLAVALESAVAELDAMLRDALDAALSGGTDA